MKIAGFYSESISNGEGLRAVLFVSGCPHHCEGCHNPVTWCADNGVPYIEENIFSQINENPYLEGLTLSGGEPLLYYKQLTSLVLRVKQHGLNVWCYTGFTFEQLYEQSYKNDKLKLFLNAIDILVDGKFELTQKNDALPFRGSSNQRIVNVKEAMKTGICESYTLQA